MRVVILEDAVDDVQSAVRFYDSCAVGVGDESATDPSPPLGSVTTGRWVLVAPLAKGQGQEAMDKIRQ